jgi:transposase
VVKMAMTKQRYKNDCMILNTLEDLVPKDHLVRKMDNCIDFTFIEELVKDLYSDVGRPSIPPVVLFKLIFINITFGINSMRRTCEESKVNIAYRWFLGLSIYDEIPNYSTWSQNYIRRYKESNIFNEIFDKILKQAIEYDFVDMETVFGDSTHQKANANKNKNKDVEVKIVKKVYEDEMLEEINKDRLEHGKKPIKELNKKEIMFNEETGEVIENVDTKHIKESLTDPESGCFHKGEKEKCFAYSHHTFCDKNGFVIANVTIPGNVHDSVSFYDAYNMLNNRFKDKIKNICLDAAYTTPPICREIINNGHIPLMPYKRPMTGKGLFKKYEYVYDDYYDCYICPNNEILPYSTTDKNGYKLYKSDPNKCANCPLKNECTKSKSNQKVITRHIWEEYKEQMNENRYTQLWKDNYPLRKETIERTFGDCKEQHGLRFTRVRGLLKNEHNVTMIFACHNLKKMATWKWKTTSKSSLFSNIFQFFMKIRYFNKQKAVCCF